MNNEDRKADLEPFIESIRGNGNDSAEYIAGFRDAQGEIAGPVVPLSAEVVQRAVLASRHESGESVRHLRTYGDHAARKEVSRRSGLRSGLSVGVQM